MTTDLHSLLAPYALDALDPHERARFEAHLDECADCRGELGGFLATAARIGEAESHEPPADLRERLLGAVSSIPQERPVVTALAQRRGLRRALPRMAAAAALVVGIVGVGGYVVERGEANDERQQNVAITSVLAAPDASTTSQSFEGGGNLRLISSATQDAAIVVANDLPALKDDKVYQVWMIKGSAPSSQGTFETSGTMVMKDMADADQLAITVEPAGGSKQPTTTPIVTVPV